MSFIQTTVQCTLCGKEMNVAFGIVGMTMIADGGPKDCPDCHGPLKKISDGWKANQPDCLTCGHELKAVRDSITDTFTGYLWTCPKCDPDKKIIISIG